MTTNRTDQRRKAQATADDAIDERDESNSRASFPIVGIGASAGGLEAFTELLKHLPLDTGMGFVLVQHLDPQHESALTQLLSRATSMPVSEVTNKLRVEANRVYIIPPNTNLSITQGILKLQPRPQTRAPHRSVDFFFESLAQDQRERAIGVVLSGTATDGTVGLEAIKAEGGITFAQDKSARHDSMPNSAVAAGCVDFVLSPEKIANELARIAKHPYVAGQPTELLTTPENDRESATAHEDDETPLPSGGHGTPNTAANQAHTEADGGGEESAGSAKNGFKKILLLLHNHSGVDFSLYKSTTIQRRITRRMVLNKQDTPKNYADFLRGNAKELDALYSDVLICVTSFFRNPEAFDVLQRKVFPKLLQQRSDDPLRVWVLGCSTGQEAYSIAMAFVEAAEKAPHMRKLQIFATDLNDALLDKARHGLYAKSLAEDISPERLRRFFIEEEGGYRIIKSLREMVVFARQNLISDPPFSRMDLITCRNLLIYLEPSLQQKALPTFHYALKPEGFLFLGASESIGSFTELFEPADKKHKIYSKKAAPTPSFHLPLKKERGGESFRGPRPPSLLPMSSGQEDLSEGFRGELNAQREADRVTVTQYAPPGVLINAELQILQFRGSTSAYLEPPMGKASFDVLKMAREGLMLPLRTAINKAKKENKTARKQNVQVNQAGATRTVNLEVIPLKNLRERCFLILFMDAEKAGLNADSALPQQAAEPRGTPKKPQPATKKESRRIAELETELYEARDYLQSIHEQYEASNEELQASSEEVQSSNEELQSVNEELETSKEELESTNEELTTVNEEMANRNIELNRLNSDLVNLQNSTHLTIVLLARDLTIRRFSKQAEKQFNLLASDVGRPISNVRHNLVFDERGSKDASVSTRQPRQEIEKNQAGRQVKRPPQASQSPPDLESFIAEVIANVREREWEVRDKEDRWYSLRVRPYMTLDNKVDGALLVLVDIDAIKRNERIQAALDFAQSTVDTIREPFLVLDSEMRVCSASRAYCEHFSVSPEETVGRFIYDLGNRQWNIPRLRTLLDEVLPKHKTVADFEVENDFGRLGRRAMLLNACRLEDAASHSEWILLAIADITERRRRDDEVQRANLAAAVLATARDPVLIVNSDLRVYSANKAFYKTFGVSPGQLRGRLVYDLGVGQWTTLRLRQLLEEIIPRNSFFDDLEVTFQFESDRRRNFLLYARVLQDFGEDSKRILLGIQDITEVLQFQAAVRESEARKDAILKSALDAIITMDYEGKFVEFNPAAEKLFGYAQAEVLGKPIAEFIIPARWREQYHQGLAHYLATGEAPILNRQIEMPALCADGTEFLAEFAIVVIPGTQPPMFTCFLRDVTEQKKAEEALREAGERKNEFLAMLAHELRNPLAPIRNALQILRLSEGNSEAVQSASMIMERQVHQMVLLVDDLLDASRITQGKIEIRRDRIELAAVVHNAVEAARPLVHCMNHELTITLPPEPVYLNADLTRLAQVMSNLLNNACKFTERDGHIWLTVERADDHVIIRVQDNGIGIAGEQLPRIFDMFTQLDTSLERTQGGLGIGLSLVKKVVEMHDGTVEARSAGIGQGSEFVVRLPIIVEMPKPPPPNLTVSDLPPALPRRILVVDDNRDSAISLATLLKLAGNETHIAYDGVEAVEAAATFRPEVVLLDIGLPKLNGFDACRKIREQPWGKGMVLIALTGWGQDEDRRKSQEAGFNGHLVKPVENASLTKLLTKLLAELLPTPDSIPLRPSSELKATKS